MSLDERMVRSNGRQELIYRAGGGIGFRCMLIAYPDTGQGAIVMTNADSGDTLCLEILESCFHEYGWDYLMVSF